MLKATFNATKNALKQMVNDEMWV